MQAIILAWHKVEHGNEYGVGDGDNTNSKDADEIDNGADKDADAGFLCRCLA